MNEVEKVKNICKERNIPISQLEKDCGFCNGYVGQLKKGVFPSDRLMRIAKYLNLSLSDLSDAATNVPVSYMATTQGGEEIIIDQDIKDVLDSPDKDRLLAYAKKLKELRNMDDELK